VHIGYRLKVLTPKGTFPHGPHEHRDFEDRGMTLGIEGWERLGELVDEWRAREATRSDPLRVIDPGSLTP
jgi:hypothetical protein